MNTLYIIGNGFDVAHGLKTQYWELRKYIENKDPDFLTEFEKIYDIFPLDDTEPWYTDDAQEQWNKSVDKILWSAFESSMGNPNINEMLEWSTSVTEDMPTIGIQDHMDNYWRREFGFINKLQKYVKEWIETINTDKIQCKKADLMNSNDLFLNFNYTDILEKVYKIKNVVHIHGGVSSVCDTNPMMGHCNKEDIIKHRQWAKEALDEFLEAETSIQNAIANYLETIYKDTNRQIALNRDFFEKLSAVENVIIIGWSAGDVDIPYLVEITNHIRKKQVHWTLYWYDDIAYQSLKHSLEKVGIDNSGNVDYIQSSLFWDR